MEWWQIVLYILGAMLSSGVAKRTFDRYLKDTGFDKDSFEIIFILLSIILFPLFLIGLIVVLLYNISYFIGSAIFSSYFEDKDKEEEKECK